MDCNKEEATRAKKLAEEKMVSGDFVGAHKFVLTAQRLFPELENILQMLAICEVHSSADKKIHGLDDWYGILQVQFLADADTIRKQYRKLALLLHPDKNKFAGAEAAFKLVGEANRFLSDKMKRPQYDVRYRSHSLFAKQANANSGRQCSAANNAAENFASGFSFWTCCKNCGQRYKYLKQYMNKFMHCSNCQSSYVACDIGLSCSTAGVNGTVGGTVNKKNQQSQKRGADVLKPQPEADKAAETSAAKSMPDLSAPEKSQAAKKRRKVVEESSKNFEVDGSDVAGAKTDTNESNKRKSSKKKPQVSYAEGRSDCDFVSPPTKKTKSGCEFESDSNTKQTAEDNKSPGLADSGVSPASLHANKGKAEKNVNSGNEDITSAKNKESEGCDGGNGADEDMLSAKSKESEGCDGANGADEDILSAKSKESEGCDGGNGADEDILSAKSKESEGCDGGNGADEDVLSAKSKESEGCDGANGADEDILSAKSKESEGCNGGNGADEIPDPEFNVFEDERKQECFAVNQVWSTCDSRDGMPRRYARVKKVLASKFKLRITYLEPVREKNDESIPVACGKFKNGETKEVEDRSIFSGQMFHSFCNRIDTIHPRKEEIWAIFRDWNEEWKTSVEKHKLPYQYDFVEIVNEFQHDYGIGVAYLGKIKGFVSLFHREAQNGVCQIQFSPKEMLRFSHKVPAVKMTGKDRECVVPADSYELDPKSLPKYIFQVDANSTEIDSETMKGKADGPYPEPPKTEVKAKPAPELAPSPRKRRKSDANGGGCSNLGEVKGRTRRSHDFSSCQVDEKNTPNESRKNGEAADVFKLRKSPRLQTAPSQQRDENCELPSLSKQKDLPTQLDGSTNDSPETTPVSSSCKTPRRNAFDFKNQRSEDKFRVNQIWAIYSNDKGMPREYVKIKKIDTKPGFMLHVTHMELNLPSTEPVTRPVSCGEFKLKTKKAKILPRTSFSHQVNPVDDAKRNIVRVQPREGEIWALYKNCDGTKEEVDIVQVVKDYCDGGEMAEAVALTAKGSGSQYVRSDAGFIDISKAEMSHRFAHQIPAIKHQKRRTRLGGEGGYWELDPRAIPGQSLS